LSRQKDKTREMQSPGGGEKGTKNLNHDGKGTVFQGSEKLKKGGVKAGGPYHRRNTLR